MKCLFKKYTIQAESVLSTVWEKLQNTQKTSLCETSTHHFLRIYIYFFSPFNKEPTNSTSRKVGCFIVVDLEL